MSSTVYQAERIMKKRVNKVSVLKSMKQYSGMIKIIFFFQGVVEYFVKWKGWSKK